MVEASRLCAAAAGGQILVSDIVRALAGSRTELELRSLGALELKGLPEPLAVCEVDLADRDDRRRGSAAARVRRHDPAFPFAGRAEDVERARPRGRRRSKARAAPCSCRASPASARRGS